ncbi:hypothetical protein KC367_g2237 [Hortaea werneckii]|uniref:MARVEL domain-containing protein n=2 Tax=Hortaea werneckii TaxID=91943 RepID=A0A3M7IBE4_HORWE|nr:hypothetical protein KC350_g14517 [Hortaea werneckii]KAI6830992.1 hypothetical protein KC342_g8148 [Hortaea werneckii]KAI6837390.1 hypothetical protein KC358_g5121 [Hortaea werneckii]KAI6922330.1 hypothetical protein KC348_g9817 [Hortaea werneckii]KAI6926084.1 hypothetical protein KC341_g13000 [Hortaea werneckii]
MAYHDRAARASAGHTGQWEGHKDLSQHIKVGSSIRLEPIPNYETASVGPGMNHDRYQPLTPFVTTDARLQQIEARDRRVKLWIRLLKFLERLLSLILSILTLIPLVMTLVKFFQTKNIYYSVDGTQRTAWAENSIVWYTYLYTAVAGISCLFNTSTILAYIVGVRRANAVEDVASKWEYLVQGAQIVVWAVSAGIYRYGREPVDGKFRDLWGWTCSQDAAALQAVVDDVDFEKYCGMQTASFNLGISNVAQAVLALILYSFAFVRTRSKKQAQRAHARYDEAREPLRS